MAIKKIYKNCTQNTYKVNNGSYSSVLPSSSEVENYRLKEQTYVKVNSSNQKVKKITTISYAKDGTGTANSVYKNASNVVISAPSDWNSYTDKFIVEKWTNGYLSGLLEDVIASGEITISNTADYYNGNNSEIFGVESGPSPSYILLEYSETDEITIPIYDDDQLGIQIDWDASGTGDVEEFFNGNSNNYQKPTKTWSDTQPRTIKITGNVTSFSANSTSTHASQEKMISATVNGMSTLTNTYMMFNKCKNMTSLDISNFDATNLTTASFMFNECQSLTGELDLSHFSVVKFNTMDGMFSGCKNLTSINMTGWDTSDSMSFGSMFKNCENLESLDISHFDYSSSQYNFWFMFMNCKKLITLNGYQNLPLETQVNTKYMFSGCYLLESLDLSSWDMSKVEDAQGMFEYCYALNSINGISDWDFSSVTVSSKMYGMFTGAIALTNLDISGWCVPNVDELPGAFATNAPFANDSSNLPVWGSCPSA